ncbi:hypothetical protein GNF10_25190 [Nostoc sp. UCD121]|uniref:hypothetical protein n=1 Tax=unclassified Nostoc TaxID=2593658 RepID=UPI00162882AF|nr:MULTISPECIES: hypothetical protein [unclassified Nostoc]MBC1218619.1 hypothetical protein [Nostoc sp. UCD120]MBC1279167.1 hypothetical protein [Nostoc sp. UCD121]MBC1294930.1 hypothetical protein [Nostoc sp. UCD122]
MAMTVETAQLNNQSILESFGLVEELDEQAGEIISGGSEKFSIRNGTQNRIYYTVDGVQSVIKPGQEQRISTNLGGKIRFDRDIRDTRVVLRSYNLNDSTRYEFRPNDKTSNPNDIDLYLV